MKKNQIAGEAGSCLSNVSRRRFLQMTSVAAAALALGAGCSRLGTASTRRKPNIIVIVSDDQGYAELGVQGCEDIPTPNIDSIARNGVRFTNGYVSGAVCSPTRLGLMTGRYQQRLGYDDGPPNEGVTQDVKFLPQRLKSLGYATGMVGKWHLGEKEGAQPVDRGFDEFFGFTGGAHFYLPEGGAQTPWATGPILRGREVVEEKEYLTDAFGREGSEFVERHANEPFFLYLAFNAVHGPLEAVQKYLDRFPGIENPTRRTFAAMTAAMDDAVGRLLETLQKHGIVEDTLIFYISDNGGPTLSTTSSNLPLRGLKGSLYEGGIRVPFLMQWQGVVPKGVTYKEPVISFDIHATALAVSGGSMPTDNPLDGVDLRPYLKGEKSGSPHESLYWRTVDDRAFRKGKWKLVKSDTLSDGETELFDLEADISEKNNLAKQMPDKLRELERDYQTLNAQMQDLKWINLLTYAKLKREGKVWQPKGK